MNGWQAALIYSAFAAMVCICVYLLGGWGLIALIAAPGLSTGSGDKDKAKSR